MTSPAEQIHQRALALLRTAQNDEVGLLATVSSYINQTITEYRGRFLQELVQNGFDAHPADRQDGCLKIHFDPDEGPHGVLYVANGGNPLSASNFDRMAKHGQSDKPIGVGVGNKGVGFKSVFQVCDVPEIYSALDVSDDGFGGFSFRFGTPEDLLDLAGGDEALADSLTDVLPLSILPVPVTSTPASVAALRLEGFVTVLRLRARDEDARFEIVERIAELRDSPAPLLLFLDRLTSVAIQVGEECHELTRTSVELDEQCNQVTLNGTDLYNVFRRQVPPNELQSVLTQAVKERTLDKRWLKWDTMAEVSVALPADPVDIGRAFTYLPLGNDAASPLPGHVNAPFVTDFARRGLNVEHPVNQLMFKMIAQLCLDRAEAISDSDGDANSVIDFLAWNGPLLEILESQSEQCTGSGLGEALRLPSRRGHWTCLADLYDWPDDATSVITAEAIADTVEVHVLDRSRIDASRHASLTRLADYLQLSFRPTAGDLAEWVEGLAGRLHRKKISPARWTAFYNDLPRLFLAGAAPLGGRKILLAADGSLSPCSKPKDGAGVPGRKGVLREVFFSPANSPDDDDDTAEAEIDLRPRGRIAKRLMFTHPDLIWRVGTQRTPGRQFLQQHNLVRPYRVGNVLAHVGDILRETTSGSLRREALDFCFSLCSGDIDKYAKDLSQVGLILPTIDGGWIGARSARFSKGWHVPGSDDLSALAEAAAEGSELSEYRKFLIPPPDMFAATAEQIPVWTHFFTAVGASTRPPMRLESDPRALYGASLYSRVLAEESRFARMPSSVRGQWQSALPETSPSHNPQTAYTTKDSIVWFVGQGEVGDLPENLRLSFARLVVASLPSIASSFRATTWRRNKNGGEVVLPTPLGVFLTEAAWLPIKTPGQTELTFQAPTDAWFVEPGNLAASYSPLVEPGVRRLFSAHRESLSVRRGIGLNTWGYARDASALVDHLTWLVETSDIPDGSIDHVRRAVHSAWEQIGAIDNDSFPDPAMALIVEQQGELGILSPDEDAEQGIFVGSASDDSAAARLVRELGWPTVLVDSDDPDVLDRIHAHIDSSWNDDVRLIKDWKAELVVDGATWEPSADTPRLLELLTWYRFAFATALRFPRSNQRSIGQRLDLTLDGLSRIRVATCSAIALRTDAGDRALPARLRGVLPVPGETPTLLVEDLGDEPTWARIADLSDAVCELAGQPRFNVEVELRLKEIGEHAGGSTAIATRPELADLAASAGISVKQARQLELQLNGAVGGLLDRLTRIAAPLWGVDALVALQNLADDRSAGLDEIRAAILTLTGGLALTDRLLSDAQDAQDADALRRSQGIDLSAYNDALTMYFPGERLVDNSVAIAAEFEYRVQSSRPSLLDRLRRARLTRFHSGEPQYDWQTLARLDFLVPDSSWGTTYDQLDDDVADEAIAAQLEKLLGPDTEDRLVPWEEVQNAHGQVLVDRLTTISHLVTAWSAKSKVVPHEVWAEPRAVRERLAAAGALAFEVLDEQALLAWLAALHLWPTGMPATLDAVDLGLGADALAEEQGAMAAEAAQRLRARQRLLVLDREIDVSGSLRELADLVLGNLDEDPNALDIPYAATPLVEIEARTKRRHGDGRTLPGRPGPVSRPSQEQTTAIGFVGELIAFKWLKEKDPQRGLIDENCWRSKYVEHLYPDQIGNDGLGFDFLVPRKKDPVMYEVKATQGEAGMIDLGQSEVDAAREAAGKDTWRLLVVEYALSDDFRIYRLPNPFSTAGKDLFRLADAGMRLQFKLREN